MSRSQTQNSFRETIEWFKVLLALALIAILVLVYLFVKPATDDRLTTLLIEAIPSAIVVLFAIPIVYFFLYRRGLTSDQIKPDIDIDRLAKRIADDLSARRIKEPFPQLIAFHETYRLVDWRGLLAQSQGNIDIVVYYFDSWVNANYESLVAFFRKPRTTMRVFVSDPNDATNVTCTVQELIRARWGGYAAWLSAQW